MPSGFDHAARIMVDTLWIWGRAIDVDPPVDVVRPRGERAHLGLDDRALAVRASYNMRSTDLDFRAGEMRYGFSSATCVFSYASIIVNGAPSDGGNSSVNGFGEWTN
jgi:hypothetical protein